jgi:hypothetical protein
MCYLGCKYERYIGNDCKCTLPKGKDCPCDDIEEMEVEEDFDEKRDINRYDS